MHYLNFLYNILFIYIFINVCMMRKGDREREKTYDPPLYIFLSFPHPLYLILATAQFLALETSCNETCHRLCS